MINSELFADLGIPIDYGRNPRRPAYAEAHELEDVEPNIIGRMQQLAPDTARDWRRMKSAAHADGVELLLVSGFRSVRHRNSTVHCFPPDGNFAPLCARRAADVTQVKHLCNESDALDP